MATPDPRQSSRDAGVRFEAEDLTEAFHQFDELWRRTANPAARLRALGVRGEDFVKLARGWEAIRQRPLVRPELTCLLQALGMGIKLGEGRALIDPDARWPEPEDAPIAETLTVYVCPVCGMRGLEPPVFHSPDGAEPCPGQAEPLTYVRSAP